MAIALLYEGKAKRVYLMDEKTTLVLSYKDDVTALNGQKAVRYKIKNSI